MNSIRPPARRMSSSAWRSNLPPRPRACCVLADRDPVQVPRPVRHRGRGVVGEADDFAAAFERDADVAVLALVGVVVGQHLVEGHDLVRLEDAGGRGQFQQGRRVFGDSRSDHLELRGRRWRDGGWKALVPADDWCRGKGRWPIAGLLGVSTPAARRRQTVPRRPDALLRRRRPARLARLRGRGAPANPAGLRPPRGLRRHRDDAAGGGRTGARLVPPVAAATTRRGRRSLRPRAAAVHERYVTLAAGRPVADPGRQGPRPLDAVRRQRAGAGAGRSGGASSPPRGAKLPAEVGVRLLPRDCCARLRRAGRRRPTCAGPASASCPARRAGRGSGTRATLPRLGRAVPTSAEPADAACATCSRSARSAAARAVRTATSAAAAPAPVPRQPGLLGRESLFDAPRASCRWRCRSRCCTLRTGTRRRPACASRSAGSSTSRAPTPRPTNPAGPLRQTPSGGRTARTRRPARPGRRPLGGTTTPVDHVLFSTDPDDLGPVRQAAGPQRPALDDERPTGPRRPARGGRGHRAGRAAASRPAACSATASCSRRCASAGTRSTGTGRSPPTGRRRRAGRPRCPRRPARLPDRLRTPTGRDLDQPVELWPRLARRPLHGGADAVPPRARPAAERDGPQRPQAARRRAPCSAPPAAAHLRPLDALARRLPTTLDGWLAALPAQAEDRGRASRLIAAIEPACGRPRRRRRPSR